jgi:hypothetical protein
MNTLFKLGQVVATPDALDALDKAHFWPFEVLDRHAVLDPGCLDGHDIAENHQALKDGNRIFSAYLLNSGVKIWIITEADRSSTTILLPEEY